MKSSNWHMIKHLNAPIYNLYPFSNASLITHPPTNSFLHRTQFLRFRLYTYCLLIVDRAIMAALRAVSWELIFSHIFMWL